MKSLFNHIAYPTVSRTYCVEHTYSVYIYTAMFLQPFLLNLKNRSCFWKEVKCNKLLSEWNYFVNA